MDLLQCTSFIFRRFIETTVLNPTKADFLPLHFIFRKLSNDLMHSERNMRLTIEKGLKVINEIKDNNQTPRIEASVLLEPFMKVLHQETIKKPEMFGINQNLSRLLLTILNYQELNLILIFSNKFNLKIFRLSYKGLLILKLLK